MDWLVRHLEQAGAKSGFVVSGLAGEVKLLVRQHAKLKR